MYKLGNVTVFLLSLSSFHFRSSLGIELGTIIPIGSSGICISKSSIKEGFILRVLNSSLVESYLRACSVCKKEKERKGKKDGKEKGKEKRNNVCLVWDRKE